MVGRFLNWKEWTSWQKLTCVIIAMRLLGNVCQVVAPITNPHTWRQVDTMGVALRYALRFTVEKSDIAWWMPAVLNSGDTHGIMPMEFPFLNLLGSLGFLLAGDHLNLGRSLAQLMAMLIVWGLTTVCFIAWRHIKNAPEALKGVAPLVCVCSFAAPFTAKFMPDVTAFLFCFLGIAGIWQSRFWGVIPLALGLLMKPTAGVVTALLLLHPMGWRGWLKQSVLVAAALIAPAYWYFHTLSYLKTIQAIPTLFELHSNLKPWARFVLFWKSKGIWDVLNFHGIFEYSWILVLGGAAVLWRKHRDLMILKLIGVFVLQASLIAMMSGDHARLHAYYLIGLSPVMLMMTWEVWHRANSRFIQVVFAVGLCIRSGEAMVFDATGFFDERQGKAWFEECDVLRSAVPEAPWRKNYVWRTAPSEYPLVELCLGERGRSDTAKWGVFRTDQGVPESCKLRFQTKRLKLVDCL